MGKLVDDLLADLRLEKASDGPVTLLAVAMVLIGLTALACVTVVVLA